MRPTRLTYIYLLSMMLLFPLFYEKECWMSYPFQYQPPPHLMLKAKKRLLKNFEQKELVPLAIGLIFGGKQGMKKEFKRPYLTLGMSHLFTPSGLHFTAILSLIIPITFFFSSSLKRKIRSVGTLSLSFIVFLLPALYSLKRMALLRWFHFLQNQLSLKWDFYILFLITFFIDFIFGTYPQSPLSFSYSFLFLGIILSEYSFSFLIPIALGGGQLIVQFFNQAIFPLTSFTFNFLLSTLFTFIYPLFFLSFWLQWDSLTEYLLHHFHHLVEISSTLSLKTGFIIPSFPLVLLIVVFSCRVCNKSWRLFLLIFLLLLHTEPLNLFPSSSTPLPSPYKKLYWTLPPKEQLLHSQIDKNGMGYKLLFQNKIRCNLRLFSFGWKINCNGPRRANIL